MYEKYISTIYINPDVNLSKIARQNRIIDRVVNLYIQDPINFKKVYEHFSPDIVRDDYRANHYGLKLVLKLVGIFIEEKTFTIR